MAALFTLLITFVLALATCQGGIDLPGSSLEPRTGRTGDTAVEGSVTYRERVALSPKATLVVELRDVTYADAPAPLIASQTIQNPGQVPIKFRLEYGKADIDPKNTYSISATIFESDGRMAFTNDTAHEVITRGNPNSLDMSLVLVQPPRGATEDGADDSDLVEAPVRVISANLIANEPELMLRVVYLQSTVEGCGRPGSKTLEVKGTDVIAEITLMQPPLTSWAIPCDENEVEEVLLLKTSLSRSKGYRIMVNGKETATFTLPDPALGNTRLAESLVRDFEIEKAGGDPLGYQARVVSGRPSGSCTRINGYEVSRQKPKLIEVKITHHQVSDANVMCTKDFPITETVVPLGSDFEAGTEYTVKVNEQARTFSP